MEVGEDEPNQQILYRIELEDEGYRVLTAGNGQEALMALRVERPDLVVLDLHIRGENGVQILQDIRDVDPTVPLVVYTGYPLYPDLYRDGVAFDACITKSSDLNPLKQIIGRALKRRPSGGRADRNVLRPKTVELLTQVSLN